MIQEVSSVYTSPFLDTDDFKMALRARNFPGLSKNGPLACVFYNKKEFFFHGGLMRS